MEKKFNRSERSWILYDWANSVYATIVMAAVFPIYFSSVAKGAGHPGDVWWGYATSAATLIIAVTAPLLGAVGDFRGMKKRLFTAFLFIGALFTLLLAFTDNIMLMLWGYALSYIGFAGSNLFYDSFLTDVTTSERMDRVSAYGYGFGYIGGSTIPFIASIALITFGESFGVDSVLAIKMSLVLTVVWWLVFSLPFLKNVRQVHYVETPPSKLVKHAFQNIFKTFRAIISTKKLLVFIIAYFFYIDGVGTVIHMATAYGSTLGLDSTKMILALLLTQLVAFPCSLAFSKISGKIGTIKMLGVGILVYIVVCGVGFFMGFNIEPHQFAYEQNYTEVLNGNQGSVPGPVLEQLSQEGRAFLSSPDREERFLTLARQVGQDYNLAGTADFDRLVQNTGSFLGDRDLARNYDDALGFSTLLFWILSVLVGSSQGGIQALSRSYFGKIIPPERSNEFFGFFDIFGKFAAVVGPALYALFAGWTGRSSIGILSLLLLFIIGGFILLKNRRLLEE
ncbi:MAG: MFS transporter [Syntrophomonadaceae bacterium]|nr:MFS transporter [Syntrophomonadaceae bacterium]